MKLKFKKERKIMDLRKNKSGMESCGFTIFKMLAIATLIAIVIFFSGCAVYDSFDKKLNPSPKIEKSANLNILSDGEDYYTELKVYTEKTDITEWYYHCKEGDIWKLIGGDPSQKGDIPIKYPENGMVSHLRRITCFSWMRISIVAYNNYGRRSQKSKSMSWEINIPMKLSEAGAEQINN